MTESANRLLELHLSEKPHLRLFLSADIVGSTAFKQRSKGNNSEAFPTWFVIVLKFYQLAEQRFNLHWKDISARNEMRDGDDIYGEEPELWKTIGDEVLFTKRIDHPGQAITAMHAWILTLNDLRESLKENQLDVKSTAWVADFPLRNNEIVLQKKSSQVGGDEFYVENNQDNLASYYNGNAADFLRDFIGPSIDTGFRITAFASPRKLVLSVELAYILGTEQVRSDADKKIYSRGVYILPKFDFKYDGRHSLKGVLRGAGYPIFWLDLDPDNPVYRAEDDVLRTPKPSALEIRELSHAFIAAEELLSVPHIGGCSYDSYPQLTVDEITLLVKRHDTVSNIKIKVRTEQESGNETFEVAEATPFINVIPGSSFFTKIGAGVQGVTQSFNSIPGAAESTASILNPIAVPASTESTSSDRADDGCQQKSEPLPE